MRGAPERPLRVGVIGTGHVARNAHLPAWSRQTGAAVAALCDLDAKALEAAAARVPSALRFSDPERLLEADLDAVAICASNTAHFPLAMAALSAGKHVLCEKPLGVSAAEAVALGAAADARGLVLMAHHQLRFAPAARAARAFVRAGSLGPVHHARVTALRRDAAPTLPGFIDPALAGGGALLDLGVHALDLALWLLDFPKPVRASGSIHTVHARAGRIQGRWGAWDGERFGVEDTASGFVRFENGMTLTVESAWLGHHAEEGLGCALHGEKASLRWPSGQVDTQGKTFSRSVLEPMGDEDPHASAIAAFVEAVGSGAPSPVPWNEAVVSLKIIDALYASARAGREVAID